jgi:hypothetical protein
MQRTPIGGTPSSYISATSRVQDAPPAAGGIRGSVWGKLPNAEGDIMDAATAAGGEWILTWLSPVAYFVFDVLFIALFFVATDAFLKVLRRARRRG